MAVGTVGGLNSHQLLNIKCMPRRRIGEWMYSSTRHSMEVSGQLHVLAALLHQVETAKKRGKSLYPPWNRTQ